MLALAEDTLMVHEPFNIERWAYSLGGLALHRSTYAPGLPQNAALRAFDAVIDNRTRKVFLKDEPQHWLRTLRRGRSIIKDPITSLTSEWLAQHYDLEVVALVRHQAAFEVSLKRLGWRHPFGHFVKQEAFMRTHHEPYRAQISSKPDVRLRTKRGASGGAVTLSSKFAGLPLVPTPGQGFECERLQNVMTFFGSRAPEFSLAPQASTFPSSTTHPSPSTDMPLMTQFP